MWHVSSSRPGAWLFAKSGPHLDRFLLRLSNGQVTLATLVAGIPVITIVTTGARTGQARTTPLLGVPFPATLPSSGLASGKRARPAGITISGLTRRSRLSTRARARRLWPARCKENSGRQSGSEPARSMAAMTHMPGGSRTGRSISCCSARKLRQPATPDRACQHAARYPLWQSWPVCLHGPGPAGRSRLIDPARADAGCCSPHVMPCPRLARRYREISAVIWSPNLGVLAVSAAGVLCAFPAWRTRYLDGVSAARLARIPFSLLFLELSGYGVDAVQRHVNAVDVLVRRGVDRDGSR